MRLDKKQLLSIGGLKLSNRLGELSDELISKYCAELSAFIDSFPAAEAQIKKALSGGGAVLPLLSQLSDTLANIHADDLVQDCEKLRVLFNDGGSSDKFAADLAGFLSLVGTLSVDIQMEQHKSGGIPGQNGESGGAPAFRAAKPGRATLGASVFADNTDHTTYAGVQDREAQRSILAVDDIPVTLSLLKSVLSSADYKFYGVTSGAAALDFLKEREPDMFILDIEMPNMNGFELAAKIREAGNYAPIVFLTGNTTRDYLVRAVKAGASDFLVKPVNAGIVNEKIKKVFLQIDCAGRQGCQP